MIELIVSGFGAVGAGVASAWFYFHDDMLKAIFWLIVAVVMGRWLSANIEEWTK